MFKINPHSAVVAVCILSLLCLSNKVNAQKKKADEIKPDVNPILIPIPSSEPKVELGYLRVKKSNVSAAVSVVGEKSIDELMAVSIDALLQGQAAGMQVTNVSGAPGSGALTTIRGASTLHAGTLPLYIVDGIPVKTYRFINPLGRNVDNNPLADINPGDIASITVLKDAQATALYGMRGANGVVVVTTTGGTAGKTYLDFSAYSGIISAPKQLAVLNADEYRDYIIEKETARGLSQSEITNGVGRYLLMMTPENQLQRYNNNTKWQNEVLGNGAINNYHLRLRGGDAVAKYSLSVGYTNQAGAIDNSKYERFTARFNLDYKVNRRLTILNTIAYSHGARNVVDEGNVPETNPLYLATLKSPVLTVWSQDAEGTNLSSVDSADYAGKNNPYAVVNKMKNINSSNRIMAGITGQYILSPFLTISSGIYADYIRLNETRFRPGAGFMPEEEIIRSASENNSNELMLLNENSLQYNRTFEKHSLNVFVGNAVQTTSQRNEFAMAINSPSDEFTSISATDPQLIDSISSYEPDWRLMSFFTGANYAYKERYLLGANIRADGSSRFAKGKQWGYFPSVSAGWRISAEPFFKAKKIINELKLRVSYGLTGNQEVGYNGAYNALVPAIYKNQPGVRLGALGNPDFTWEKTRQFNAGIDVLLLKRISFTADFYIKNTNDLLNYRKLAGTTGFDSYVVNDGSVKNTGVELTVSGKVLKKKLGWQTQLTVAFNKNKITSYPQGEDPTENYGYYQTSAAPGSAIGAFWGYNALGVYSSTDEVQVKNGVNNVHPFQGGDIVFEDVDQNGVIDEGDMKVIGNSNPDFFGGFSNTFSYKNFDLNIFVDFALGREVYNAQRASLEAMTNYDNQSVKINDRWRSNGDVSTMPRFLHNDPVGNTRFSSRWIENGSYLRAKAITIGYNIPTKETRKAFKNARILLTAQNLFSVTKYKGYGAEVGSITNPVTYSIDYGNVPQLRAFVAGIQVGF
ncbi:SusC/RagA family TonB-linked outer membrane protein [Niastella sp. OAS944]|uniref:SusC/RagA family TonB-linked outer membrane protein n=1 Tax=Niastella sp. OAS944 TaxID=2664089 RepID=UPI003497CFA4|nr:TonB-linked SusC/RagA family outer membrane protein [Chitinophagaceae bacterium OAS944]